MKHFRTGLMAATAACGLLFAGAANAVTIQFSPGTANTVVDYSGFGEADPNLAGGVTDVDEFQFVAYGNNLVNGSNPDFDWNINLNLGNGTFTETFTLLLQTTTPGTGGFNSVAWGDNQNGTNGPAASYVSVVARLEGTIASDHTFPSPANVSLVYEDLLSTPETNIFDWYFWEDGVAQDCSNALLTACANAHIATMDILNGTAKQVENDDSKATLSWKGVFSSIASTATFEFGGTSLADLDTAIALSTNTIFLGGTANTITADSSGNITTLVVDAPEPGALALFGIGLLGLGIAARRRLVG